MSRVKRTMIAQAGFDFSTQFTLKFVEMRIRGDAQYTPMLAPPEQDSTGGGKQAMQPIILKAPGGGPTHTIGWVRIAEGQAQLRSYVCLQQLHAQRFPGRPFTIDAGDYDAFFREAQRWFGEHNMHLTIQHTPPAAAVPPKASPGVSLSRLATWGCVVPIILGTLVLIFVAYIWFYQRDAVFGALGMDDASSQAEKLAPGRSSAEPSLP